MTGLSEEEKQKIKDIIARNINFQLKRKGVNQTDMARDLNIPEMTVSNWINAKTYPRQDKIQMMADYFDVKRSDLTEEQPTNLIRVSPQTIQIPILGKIACGEPLLASENVESYIYKSPENLPSGELFALIAKGDSMEPTIPDGATVLLRAQPDVENGEIAAVLVNGDEEATLKRIRKENGSIWLVADNVKYGLKQLTEDFPARIIGKAISFEVSL